MPPVKRLLPIALALALAACAHAPEVPPPAEVAPPVPVAPPPVVPAIDRIRADVDALLAAQGKATWLAWTTGAPLDVAGPMRADPEPRTQVYTGQGYRLEVSVATDRDRQVLTRTIRVSDATGEDVEVHELHLIDPLEVMAALRSAGFEVTPLAHYTPEAPFPRGWSGFLARVTLES